LKEKKSYYKLWLEYLKRSKAFNNYCKAFKNRERNPKAYHNHPMRWHDKMSFVRVACDEYSFNDWWVIRKHNMGVGNTSIQKSYIREYSEKTKFDVLFCIDLFKKINGREPSLSEFVESFHEDIDIDNSYVVNPDVEIDEILKQKELRKLAGKGNKPLGNVRIRYDELKRYLKVFDLWSEVDDSGKRVFKIKDIIKAVGTKSQVEKADDINTDRVFRADIEKAKKIVANVENGKFPGKY